MPSQNASTLTHLLLEHFSSKSVQTARFIMLAEIAKSRKITKIIETLNKHSLVGNSNNEIFRIIFVFLFLTYLMTFKTSHD